VALPGRGVLTGGNRPGVIRYALKVPKVDVPANATASLAGFMVNANALGKATLTGRYGRKK
jgi:phosphatidylethanolamine-binding protein (PEBP) family uncharacterized protein